MEEDLFLFSASASFRVGKAERVGTLKKRKHPAATNSATGETFNIFVQFLLLLFVIFTNDGCLVDRITLTLTRTAQQEQTSVSTLLANAAARAYCALPDVSPCYHNVPNVPSC